MLKLDALELSDRMRTYNARPVRRVEPRSYASHLSKRVGMEVWEPATQNVGLDQQKQTSQITQTTDNVRATETSSRSETFIRPALHRKPVVQSVEHKPKVVNNARDEKLHSINFAASAHEWKKQKKSKRGLRVPNFTLSNIKNYALYGMAVIVFLIGVVAAVRSLMVDQQISQTVSAQAADGETDESKPSDEDIRSYSVSPDMPKTISIPKLNVLARVRQLEVKGDGSLDAPHNVHDAGWYKDSTKPGSPGGASLIDGHVSGPTQKGVFYRIETLQKGDIVTIERGDGTKLEYGVIKTEVVKANEVDMSKLLVPVTAGKHGLNLITCTGKFDSSTKTYEDRALVYTQFIKAY